MAFVITIAGVSGGGKTTVAAALRDYLNAKLISFDDYGDRVESDIDINELRDDKYNRWNVKPIEIDLTQLIDTKADYIVMDYPFGRLNSTLAKYINLTVFIDTPLDVALARRLIRDYSTPNAEPAELPIDEYLIEYLELQIPTYIHYIEAVRADADLIINGMDNVNMITEQITEVIKKAVMDC